jgi:hypothetical protein
MLSFPQMGANKEEVQIILTGKYFIGKSGL